MRRIWLFLAVVLMAGQNSSTKADFPTGLIDVDFNFDIGATQSGAAVIGTSGDVWNGQSNPFLDTIGVLKLATGSPSNGVAYSLSGLTNAIIIGGTSLGAQYAALMGDGYTVGPGNTMTIAFSGLTAFQPYDLYFYSSFATPSGNDFRTTTFTIAGNSLSAMNVGTPSVFIEGNNFVHFRSQPADAAGQMTVAIHGVGGFEGGVVRTTTGGLVNGFQIAAVPEPATMMPFALGGLGVLVLAGCRRMTVH